MRQAMAAAAALLLVACGGQSGNEQAGSGNKAAGGGETASAAGGNVSFEPGQWETTVQVTSINVPNMPEGMNAPLPPPTTVRSCLTPEQASQPSADFLTGSGEGGGCTHENFSMANGRIQGTVQCNAEGGSMRATMNGQFTPTTYEIAQQVQTSAAGGMTMNMESRITARRIGDCPAGG